MSEQTRRERPLWFNRLSLGLMTLTAAAVCLSLSPKAVDALGPSDQVNVPVGGSPLANLTTSPTLFPTFSQSTHDYALSCGAGANVVTMHLSAGPSGSVQVGNQTGASITLAVTLGESQAAVVKAKDSSQQVVAYWIRCLPHDFPQMQVSKPGNPPDGYYLTGTVTSNSTGTTGTYAMVLDRNGTPVWYQGAPGGAINVERISSNTIAWAPSLELLISFNRSAISPSARSHVVRSNRPEPFGPTRRMGCKTLSC